MLKKKKRLAKNFGECAYQPGQMSNNEFTKEAQKSMYVPMSPNRDNVHGGKSEHNKPEGKLTNLFYPFGEKPITPIYHI